MIQIVFIKSKIKADEWEIAYSQIVKIVSGFPFKLLRLESYNGFHHELDKYHSDIFVNKGTDEEYISFFSDKLTFKGGNTVRFYKKWEKQISNEFKAQSETDFKKPIYWFPINDNAFTGNQIKANGVSLFPQNFESVAIYQYVVVAIGLFLENFFTGRVLLIINDLDIGKISETKKWTEWLLKEKFDMPVYLDKHKMLSLIIDFYEKKEDLVGRIENLYPGSFIDNMTFSIENIGYIPTLNFYAKLLSTTGFNTFGFSDILQPWIAVTKDLDKSLTFIAISKQILLTNGDERSKKVAEQYDFKIILKCLLSDFILWSPEQKEKLDIFYTNKKALHTGREDLFETIKRLTGYRVDICPIYATQQTLFETFMYFNPNEGTEYLQIINDWVEENKNSYDEFLEKLSNIERDILSRSEQTHEKPITKRIATYISEPIPMHEMFPKETHFFINELLCKYPYIDNIDNCIYDFLMELTSLHKNEKSANSICSFFKSPREDKLREIKYMIKQKRMTCTTGENFIKQIAAEDESTITDLFFILATKVFDDKLYIAKQHLIYDNSKWDYLKSFGFTAGIIETSSL